MKHRIVSLFIFVLFIQVRASAQEYILGYYHNILMNKDFKVELWINEKSSAKNDLLAIETKPLYSESGWIVIKLSELDSFVKSFKKLKNKVLEWAKVVNEKNIVIEKKDIPIKFPDVSFGWGGGENNYHFAFNETPHFYFSSSEGGSTIIEWNAIVHTSDYEHMEGFLICFIDLDEYDRLLELLDVKKIKELSKKRHKELDLLK